MVAQTVSAGGTPLNNPYLTSRKQTLIALLAAKIIGVTGATLAAVCLNLPIVACVGVGIGCTSIVFLAAKLFLYISGSARNHTQSPSGTGDALSTSSPDAVVDGKPQPVPSTNYLQYQPLKPCRPNTDQIWYSINGTKHFVNLDTCGDLTSIDDLQKHIPPLSDLDELRIRLESLRPDGLKGIEKATKLTKLDLKWCNQITDDSLVYLQPLHNNLTSLDLFACDQVTDKGIKHLSPLKKLTELNLSLCFRITNKSLLVVKEFSKLTRLGLSSCSKVDNEGVKHLKELPYLAYLDLSFCSKITDEGLKHLKELKHLTHLVLSRCTEITDEGLKHLKELTLLTHLDLYWCSKITDEGLKHLKELTLLTHLDLTRCTEITDEGLKHLKELTHLACLNLYHCSKITVEGLKQLPRTISVK